MRYGIDIGGSKIELAIYDQNLDQIDVQRVPTPLYDYSEFLNCIKHLVLAADEFVAATSTLDTTSSVGIGIACIFDEKGCAISANIKCINKQNLHSDLSHLLNRMVFIENDANTLVLSESNGGAGDYADIVLALVLGTGVAGGLVIGGRLYKSSRNLACEFGHLPLPSLLQQRYQLPLLKCGCGLQSCMDQYLSGPGLLRLCATFDYACGSVPDLINAVLQKDLKAESVFSAYLDCLGCFVAQLTMSYDPDVIVLGGGLSNIAKLYERLPLAIKPYLFNGVMPPRISPPCFGDSSGVRGAALLTADTKQNHTSSREIN